MASDTPDRGIFVSRVLRSRRVCREHFEITLGLERFPPCRPGQFLQVLCREPSPAGGSNGLLDAAAPLLRRPFSIGGLRRVDSVVEIVLLGRVVGAGTAWLGGLAPGHYVDILGPLGNAFSLPSPGQRAILIAGGIGLPPIRWLAEELAAGGVSCEAIVGARSRDLLPITLINKPAGDGVPTPCTDEFARLGVHTAITTDDGSCGLHGRVTDALDRRLPLAEDVRSVRAYACGPEPMLRAVAAIGRARGIDCELAMERVMGCGMGTCQSCVVAVHDSARENGWRYALCCTEGPVFNALSVKWD